MKCKLLRHDKEPLELDIDKIDRVSGICQSNIIVITKTGESHSGYLFQF